MSYIKRIQLRNYFFIEEADVEIGKGSFYIHGSNHDELSMKSNGAGKTLFASSLFWILFQYIRGDSLVKDAIGSYGDEAWGRATLDIGGRELIVERTRTKSKCSVNISLDGVDHSVHKNPEAKIEQILGVAASTFMMLTYNGLFNSRPVIAFSDTELKNEVMKLLGLERFKEYDKEFLEEKRSIETSLRVAESEARKNLEIYEEASADIDREAAKLATFDTELKQEIDDLQIRRDALDLKIKAEREKSRTPYEIRQAIDALKSQGNKYEASIDRLGKLVREKSDLERKKRAKSESISALEVEAKDYKSRVDNLIHNHDKECNYCGAEINLTDELIERARVDQEKLDDREGRVIVLGIDVKRLQKEIDEVEQKILEERLQKEDLAEAVQQKKELELELRAAEAIDGTVRAYTGQMRDIEARIKSLRKRDKSEIHSRLDQLEEKREIREEMYLESETKVMSLVAKRDAIDAFRTAISTQRDAIFNTFAISMRDEINRVFKEFCESDFHCALEDSSRGLKFVFTSISKAEYYPWSVFSGGEQLRISKAVSLAVFRLFDLPLLVEDESFDGTDDARAALELIEEVMAGRTLLHISHRVHSQDYLKKSERIHCSKKNGKISAERILD